VASVNRHASRHAGKLHKLPRVGVGSGVGIGDGRGGSVSDGEVTSLTCATRLQHLHLTQRHQHQMVQRAVRLRDAGYVGAGPARRVMHSIRESPESSGSSLGVADYR